MQGRRDIPDPTIPSKGVQVLDLPLEIRQTIFSHLLGWSPTTPPLLFDCQTQRKLVASVQRNDARIKRNRKTALKQSEYLQTRQMWPDERFQLATLRALLLTCRQISLDMHGMMGMKASDLILSNQPRTILEVNKMLQGGDTTVWPSTLVLTLFPLNNTIPGQKRLGPSNLTFAPQCGVAAVDEQAAAYATLAPRQTPWPPFWKLDGATSVFGVETWPYIMLGRLHRHLERWIEVAFRLPQQVRFVKVEVDVSLGLDVWAGVIPPLAVATIGQEIVASLRATQQFYVQLKDVVELVRVLRLGKSPTCEFGGEGAVEVEGGPRKVVLIGRQTQAELGKMSLAASGSLPSETLMKDLEECLKGYRKA